MGCCDLLAGPHEQGIGGIGTMGIGRVPRIVWRCTASLRRCDWSAGTRLPIYTDANVSLR
jgi:hypothetical protein